MKQKLIKKQCKAVTNKEICGIRVVFIFVYSAASFVLSATDWEKTLFSSQVDCCVRLLLHQTRYYDIVKFQIGLVILPSSKNFDKRLT